MSAAKQGDTVKVHYTGRLNDGSEFDSSLERQPLEFVIGQGQIIPGFEQAVVGMSQGDTKTIEIAPENAYGPRHDEAVQEIPKSALPESIQAELQTGMRLQANDPNGRPLMLTVTHVAEENITVDANHPLAGQALTFDLELVEIA